MSRHASKVAIIDEGFSFVLNGCLEGGAMGIHKGGCLGKACYYHHV
jgi:hypothetical protein